MENPRQSGSIFLKMEADQTGSEGTRKTSGRNRRLRSAGSTGLFLIAILGLIHIPPVRTAIFRIAINSINPFETARITIEDSSGFLFADISLSGVSVIDGSQTSINISDLHVRFNLLDLLFHRELSSLEIKGIRFSMEQRENGEWSFPQMKPTNVDSTPFDSTAIQVDSGPFVIRSIKLDNLSGRFSYWNAHIDSTWNIHSATAQIKDFQSGSVMAAVLDTLQLQFSPVMSTDTVIVSASGVLQQNQLRALYFSLESDLSTVYATGTFPVTSARNETGRDEVSTDTVRLSIHAPSLALRDIDPFVGGLNTDTRISLDLEIDGSWNDLIIDFAAFLPGRSSVVGSGSVKTVSDSVHVEANMSIHKLRFSDLFSRLSSPIETISASIDVNLTGIVLDQLNGRLSITAEHVADGIPLIDALSFEQTFVNGRGVFSLDVSAQAGVVNMSGWIRPMDTEITWEAEGMLDIVDLRKTGIAGDLPFEFAGRLRSSRQKSDLTASASLTISTGRSGECEIKAGTINALLSARNWSARGEIDLCKDSSVSGQAQSTPGGGWTAFSEFRDLNIMAILGDSVSSSISGEISLSSQSAEDTAIRADFFLVDAHYDQILIDSVRAHVSMHENQFSTTFEAHLDSMIVTGNAWLETGQDGFSMALDELSFKHLNVERLMDREASEQQFSSDLSGGGNLDLTLDEAGLITTKGSLALIPSTVNHLQISSSTISWSSGTGSITFETHTRFGHTDDMNRDQPSLHFTGHLTQDFNHLTMQDFEAEFRGIDMGKFAGIDDVSTSLSGAITMHGDVKSGELQLQIFPGSSMNRMVFDAFHVESNWNESRFLIEGIIGSMDGTLTGNGSISRDPSASSGIELRSSKFDFSALLGDLIPVGHATGDSATTSSVSFSGSIAQNAGEGPVTWNVDIDSLGLDWNGLSIRSGGASISLSPEHVQIDTLYLAGIFGTIKASGTVSFDSDNSNSSPSAQSSLVAEIRLSATETLGPLSSFVPVTWSVLESDLRVKSKNGIHRLEANINSGNLRYKGIRIAFSSSEIRAELDSDFRVIAGELESAMEIISAGGVVAESVDINVVFLEDEIALKALMRVDNRRQILAEMLIDTFADPPVIQLEEFIAELDTDVWKLTAPARVTLKPVPEISSLVIRSDDGRLAAMTVGMSGSEAILIDLENFNLMSISDVFDFEGLGGVFDGRMILTRPEETFDIEASISGSLVTYSVPAGSLSVQIALEKDVLQFNAKMDHISGQNLRARGVFDLRDENITELDSMAGFIDFTLAAENFEIDWTLPFLDLALVDHVSGVVTTDVSVHGTWSEPYVSGTFALKNGILGLTELGKRGRGLRYEKIETDLVFHADSAFVHSFSAHSGSGKIEISGEFALPTLTLGKFSLDVEAKNFLAVDNSIYRAVIDGSLQLSGTTDAPVLSGDLRIPSATYFLTSESAVGSFEPIALSEEDVLIVERSFGIVISDSDTSTFDLYTAMKIENLTVRFDRDSWFRSRITPDMDIQFIGDLEISKEPDEDPIVFGTIEVLPERSQIVQFGRKFRITRGTISLNGPIDNPTLDLEATFIVPSRSSFQNEVTIRLLLRGDMESMNLSFESDPPMELSDVISYIVTGRPAGESLQVGGSNDQYGGTAASLAVGPMTFLAESIAGESLGLDVVEISYDAILGLKFTGGKYLSPKLYVAVSQPLTTASSTDKSVTGLDRYTSVTIEYEIIRNFLAALLTRGPILNYSVRWRHDF